MREKKRRCIWTLVMAAAIVVIFTAGIMTVGNLKGWFDKDGGAILLKQPDGTVKMICVTAQNKTGTVNITRNGVSYLLEDSQKLRDGDTVETLNGASIDLALEENTVSLDENSAVTVSVSDGVVSLTLSGGELFADVASPFQLSLMDTAVTMEDGLLSASATNGSLSVFGGTATVGAQALTEGTVASILPDGIQTENLAIQSLNRFDLSKLTGCAETRALCFTKAELDGLKQERDEAKKISGETKQEMREQATDEQQKENMATQTAAGSDAQAESTAGSKPTCTIEIRCDTILDNMGDLSEGKSGYVPSNGTILAASTIQFSESDTVFDVLKKACSLADIQIEYAFTPIYNSYYIEGINQLYEFDCGGESGWMYKVNGWFPNYGCSAYAVKDGDEIVWCYTCKGLGTDVGGNLNR